jgi:LacI family transcriptional regulator, gluconate utilization system Gnt-I transcriptional repressor
MSVSRDPSSLFPKPAKPAGPRNHRKGHGRVTLDDVARLAQVTSITVSRYLREPHKLAPETAERVRAALQQTAYVPHKQAGHLASGRSTMVAALIPNVGHSIFGETVQGLAERLQGAGYELLIAATGYSLDREEEQLRAVLGWLPAAVVVTGRQHTTGTIALLQRARDGGMPVVEMWDHQRGQHEFAQVGFSHAAVGQAMAQHLLDRSHKHLVYVDTPVADDLRAHERADAFLAEAQRGGAQVELLHTTQPDSFDAGREALQHLIATHQADRADTAAPAGQRPRGAGATAMAFANDHIAAGALLQARRIGIAVPGDLALLGFGDFPIARQLDPPLSTVRPPRHEIGYEAARQVVAALRDGRPALGCALDWETVQRGTT